MSVHAERGMGVERLPCAARRDVPELHEPAQRLRDFDIEQMRRMQALPESQCARFHAIPASGSQKQLEHGGRIDDDHRPSYAREGVAHAWLVDPVRQTLEVLALESGKWSLLGRHEGSASVRAAPFDVLELELGALWIRRA